VLVAWTRIIYPDGSSLDLGKMPGADSAGYAGLHDKVNNHFWRAFKDALMLSVFSAGVQISQGGDGGGGYGMNARQTIAAGMGQQLGQLGQEMSRRNIRIQPTIEIRQGSHFVVMVTKDIIISPWRGHKN
jgi:type IV secretion system protein VirB10